MEPTSLIAFLIIGAVAGWLAGLLMRGGGFGLLGNIVVGIIGAFVGAFWSASQPGARLRRIPSTSVTMDAQAR